jgi:hypothetical protein
MRQHTAPELDQAGQPCQDSRALIGVKPIVDRQIKAWMQRRGLASVSLRLDFKKQRKPKQT